jgi:hydroxyacylglutathione hydrolase
VPPDTDVYLIVDGDDRLDEAARDLRLIGLDRVRGVAGPEVLAGWEALGHDTAQVPRLDADSAARQLRGGALHVVDVRSTAEWQAGHIPGAQHIPLGELRARAGTIPGDRPVVVHCQGGARSAIAASILQEQGLSAVFDLPGGFNEWCAAGGQVEQGSAREPVASRG